MGWVFLSIQINFEAFSSRLYYPVYSGEAFLTITQCNWRRSTFFSRSAFILIRALYWFRSHYPSQHILYSNIGLTHVLLHEIRLGPRNAHMHLGFPTCVNSLRYLYSATLLEDFNNSFTRLVESFCFLIHFSLPSDYNRPQNPQQCL